MRQLARLLRDVAPYWWQLISSVILMAAVGLLDAFRVREQRSVQSRIHVHVERESPSDAGLLFLAYQRNPRQFNAGRVTQYRLPTLLERKGDFSQTLDNNGNPFPYVRDYTKSGTCSATSAPER